MMRAVAIAALAVLQVLAAPARATADAASTKEAMVLLRILSYDRYVAKRARSHVVIGVVRDDGDAQSRRAASSMAEALRTMSRGVTVAGKPVAVVEIASSDLFRDRLRDLEVTAVYLAPGLDGELDMLNEAARAHPCLTFTDRMSYMRRGVAVALGSDDRRRRIIIQLDLVAARAQGAQLSAELLHVAEVVRR
jgi:YfiR/HmsC-like